MKATDKHTGLTVDRARELLDYNPENGTITWRFKVSNRRKGSLAGAKTAGGHLATRIGGRLYRNHRLAWLLVTGCWPLDEIDHINGLRDDNRWLNLREADTFLNRENQHIPTSSNSSGYLGVSWHSRKSRFRARIRTRGKTVLLGYFKDPAEAHQAYLTAKRELHAGCTL